MNSSISNHVQTTFGILVAVALFFLLVATGCDSKGYNVMLATDSKEFREGMTWEELREANFKKPYSLRVVTVDGISVPLFRFNHDDGSIDSLEEDKIHLSMPIITKKSFDYFTLVVYQQSNELKRVNIVVGDLAIIKEHRKAYVIPLSLP